MFNPRIALLGIALGFFAGAAGAQVFIEARNPDPQISTQSSGPFATVEARRAAQPMPFPTYPVTSRSRTSGGARERGTTPGQAPDPAMLEAAATRFSAERALASSPAPATAPGVAPSGGTNFGASPGIYTQYCENCDAANYNFPQSAIGKLFFSTPTGTATCTASLIGQRVAVTAAHCCYDVSAGAFYSDFTFMPDYRNGAAPFGAWTWTFARVVGSYRTAPSRGNDICMIRFGTDTAGFYPGDYTGWLGSSWGAGFFRNAHAVGYPGNIGGGEYMELCTSQTNRPNRGCTRLNTINMGCSMTYGASGGPWITQYRGAGPNANYVMATVSGWDSASCTGTFGEAFNGAYFNAGNFRALCDAGGWC